MQAAPGVPTTRESKEALRGRGALLEAIREEGAFPEDFETFQRKVLIPSDRTSEFQLLLGKGSTHASLPSADSAMDGRSACYDRLSEGSTSFGSGCVQSNGSTRTWHVSETSGGHVAAFLDVPELPEAGSGTTSNLTQTLSKASVPAPSDSQPSMNPHAMEAQFQLPARNCTEEQVSASKFFREHARFHDQLDGLTCEVKEMLQRLRKQEEQEHSAVKMNDRLKKELLSEVWASAGSRTGSAVSSVVTRSDVQLSGLDKVLREHVRLSEGMEMSMHEVQCAVQRFFSAPGNRAKQETLQEDNQALSGKGATQSLASKVGSGTGQLVFEALRGRGAFPDGSETFQHKGLIQSDLSSKLEQLHGKGSTHVSVSSDDGAVDDCSACHASLSQGFTSFGNSCVQSGASAGRWQVGCENPQFAETSRDHVGAFLDLAESPEAGSGTTSDLTETHSKALAPAHSESTNPHAMEAQFQLSARNRAEQQVSASKVVREHARLCDQLDGLTCKVKETLQRLLEQEEQEHAAVKVNDNLKKELIAIIRRLRCPEDLRWQDQLGRLTSDVETMAQQLHEQDEVLVAVSAENLRLKQELLAQVLKQKATSEPNRFPVADGRVSRLETWVSAN